MKHIDVEKGTFVRNMLIVDPRTGNGGYALIKCSIEDALACEMVTQDEIDAARQAKQDQIEKGYHTYGRNHLPL